MTVHDVATFEITDYLRQEMMPHFLCPGCGHGIAVRALLWAVHELGIEKDNLAIVSGIGYDQVLSVQDQPARFCEAAEGVLLLNLDARVHSTLPDACAAGLFRAYVPVVACLLRANLPIIGEAFRRKRALPRRHVQNSVGGKTEVGVME